MPRLSPPKAAFLLPLLLAALLLVSPAASGQTDEPAPPDRADPGDATPEAAPAAEPESDPGDALSGEEGEAPVQEAAGTQAAPDEPEPGLERWNLRLFADERYRFRRAENPVENDHQISFFVDFGAHDADGSLGVDLAFGLWMDLNGTTTNPGPALTGMRDNVRNFWLDLYRLSVDYRAPAVLKLGRAGRQPSERGKSVTFDGLSLIFTAVPSKLEVFVHGGRSVHFFEVDNGGLEDFLASTGLTFRPLPDLRFDLDYLFTWEDIPSLTTPGISEKKENVDSHSVGFTGWYRYERWVQLKAGLRSLNEQIAETSAHVRSEWEEQLLGLDFQVKVQPATLREVADSFDPFFTVLGESLPHARFTLDIWKGFDSFAGVYTLHVGYEGRQLLEGDEKPFNRNFGRAYLLVSAENIAQTGLYCSVQGERWGDGPALGDDGLWALGGGLGWRHQYVDLGAGTLYQRYKYDYYLDVEERADVQTFYGEIKGKPLSWLRLYGRYEYELADRDIHTLTVGMSQIF